MSAKSLTAPMAICLAETIERGGKLVRYVGGYWSWPDAPRRHSGIPVDSFGANTVDALVTRGRMKYVDWRDGHGGRFPIAAQAIIENGCGNG